MTPDKLNKYRKGNFELKSKHIYAKKKLENIRDYILLSHNLVGGGNVLIDYDNATKDIEAKINNDGKLITDFGPIENTIKTHLKDHMQNENVQKLIFADKELTNTFSIFYDAKSNSTINDTFKKNLINIQKNLFKLQVKIIFSNLKKIKGVDINPILDVINNKIEMMNKYIENQDLMINDENTSNPVDQMNAKTLKEDQAQINANKQAANEKALKEEEDLKAKEENYRIAKEEADKQKAAQIKADEEAAKKIANQAVNATTNIVNAGIKNAINAKAKEEAEAARLKKEADLVQIKADEEAVRKAEAEAETARKAEEQALKAKEDKEQEAEVVIDTGTVKKKKEFKNADDIKTFINEISIKLDEILENDYNTSLIKEGVNSIQSDYKEKQITDNIYKLLDDNNLQYNKNDIKNISDLAEVINQNTSIFETQIEKQIEINNQSEITGGYKGYNQLKSRQNYLNIINLVNEIKKKYTGTNAVLDNKYIQKFKEYGYKGNKNTVDDVNYIKDSIFRTYDLKIFDK
jgi:hypothetical protein